MHNRQVTLAEPPISYWYLQADLLRVAYEFWQVCTKFGFEAYTDRYTTPHLSFRHLYVLHSPTDCRSLLSTTC